MIRQGEEEAGKVLGKRKVNEENDNEGNLKEWLGEIYATSSQQKEAKE